MRTARQQVEREIGELHLGNDPTVQIRCSLLTSLIDVSKLNTTQKQQVIDMVINYFGIKKNGNNISKPRNSLEGL